MDYLKNLEIDLDKYNLVGFGERGHGQHRLAIQEIAENLFRFKGLFWELPVDFQKSVNLFLESEQIDDRFNRYFQGAAKEGNNVETDTITILKAAKKYNSSIWCIDSSKVLNEEYQTKSLHGYYFLRGESRNEDMFENIVRVTKDGNEKWCILCGCQHLRYGKHFRSGDDTLGNRLKKKYSNKFINVCLANEGENILEDVQGEFDRYFIHE